MKISKQDATSYEEQNHKITIDFDRYKPSQTTKMKYLAGGPVTQSSTQEPWHTNDKFVQGIPFPTLNIKKLKKNYIQILILEYANKYSLYYTFREMMHNR